MSFQFATCERHRALKFLRRFYPSYTIEDTPECAKEVLDLVEADRVRIPDPAMHPNGAVYPAPDVTPEESVEIVAAFNRFHSNLGI